MNAVLKLVPNEKTCTKCGEVKAISEFMHNVGKGKMRPADNCKSCVAEKKKNTWAEKRANGTSFEHLGRGVVLCDGGRVCLKCDDPKAWDQFAKDVHGYNQKTATCIPCRNEKFRAAYKENPAVRRSRMSSRPDKLMKQYGITYADVVRTFDAQHGRCANRACGKEISLEVKQGHNRAMIDPNHKTGKFRALLCCACNFSLGYIEKQGNILLGLQDYLTKYNW